MKAAFLMALIVLSTTACLELADSNSTAVAAVQTEAKPDAVEKRVKKCDPTTHITSFGNQHVRYFDVCQNDIGIMFQAVSGLDGKYSVSYHVLETPCALADFTNGFFKPAALQGLVKDQVNMIRSEIDPVVIKIIEKCQLDTQIEDIFGEHFENAYSSFGDGWWLSVEHQASYYEQKL